MIIRYPTGYYTSALPSKPSDVGNVTYYISTSEPPRTQLQIPQVPLGIVQRAKPPRDLDPIVRRSQVGELIYTISEGTPVSTATGKRQYDIGQIIEFSEDSGSAVDPMLVTAKTEVRHDTNLYDLTSMGLTNEEISTIENTTLVALGEITDQLNRVKQLRSDTELEINALQKTINELNKTISSLSVTRSQIGGTGEIALADIIDKLEDKLASTIASRDLAIETANAYAAEASNLYGQLLAVGVLVR